VVFEIVVAHEVVEFEVASKVIQFDFDFLAAVEFGLGKVLD
jgi:hypothetical protein